MSKLADIIKRRIQVEGPIPFAQFMETALYYPGLGYYASEGQRIGAAGDYYTSPQAHPVFGALIALQLERLWQVLERPSPFHVVEAGAGKEQLALDVLDFSRHLEEGFRAALFYVTVDIRVGAHSRAALPIPPHQRTLARRSGRLAGGDPAHPHSPQPQHTLSPPSRRFPPFPRAVASRGLPFRGVSGCILSNELLDAFPVHRLRVQGGALREVYVTLEDGAFAEVLGELSTPVCDLMKNAGGIPPEGSSLEVCPDVWAWMAQAAQALERGLVLTIDYGYWDAPGDGTIASYRRHRPARPYDLVGQQDLTARVDFGAAMEAGRRVGLAPVGLVSQRRFLLELGLGAFREAAARSRLPQRQHEANQLAMLDLVRPEGLGSFGVMVQRKGLEAIAMSDLASERPVGQRLAAGELPVPLLTRAHVPLLEGRYPHLAGDIS